MTAQACVILCTCPDEGTANQIAEALLAQRLAACVNRLAAVESLFLWRGQSDRAQEHLLMVKTRTDLYGAAEALIQNLHPYDVPEIVALPIIAGSARYLAWIDEETARESRS